MLLLLISDIIYVFVKCIEILGYCLLFMNKVDDYYDSTNKSTRQRSVILLLTQIDRATQLTTYTYVCIYEYHIYFG